MKLVKWSSRQSRLALIITVQRLSQYSMGVANAGSLTVKAKISVQLRGQEEKLEFGQYLDPVMGGRVSSPSFVCGACNRS